MKVVLDTVVFVRGLINPDSPCGRVVFANPDAYELIVSAELALEYLDVFSRPKLARRFRAVGPEFLSDVLEAIRSGTPVHLSAIPRVCRDPTDDKFLAAALAGQADFIVSEDNDLLELGSYEGITILSAQAFLAVLERDADAGS
jgi:putative PIN family toxin of toxin-antitoxin system